MFIYHINLPEGKLWLIMVKLWIYNGICNMDIMGQNMEKKESCDLMGTKMGMNNH
jgi:hypothetical protein